MINACPEALALEFYQGRWRRRPRDAKSADVKAGGLHYNMIEASYEGASLADDRGAFES